MAGVTDAKGVESDPALTCEEPAWSSEFRAVPLPFRPRIRFENAAFAHPFEAEFARLLDFYRISWAYEPTTFPLAWDAAGKPIMHCAPDFYLPNHRLYIELTTVRQRWVTRKHRKVRLLRSTYPNVRLRVLYRRDYERLLLSSRDSDVVLDEECPGRMLYSAEDLDRKVAELAISIAAGYERVADRRPILLLGMEPGAAVFQDRLGCALDGEGVRYEHDHIALTSFPGRDASGQQRVAVKRRPLVDPHGRHVLVLAGVVSTGLSLDYLLRWLYRRRPLSVEVCALFDRRSARIADVGVRYAGFEAPADVLVGYGLNRRRQFRGLPYIARIQQSG
jgi:hypoxanthine phosphoribosyltransferase